ncbi:MAG TPA: phosphohistidine phosphatase SixA [Herpetosiphonaceae bacterium]|nr:phosphohistidine phosphatase SixA [Herpetosiphonaceae bacterium]
MIVYLVRHGIAEDWAANGRDRDRRLTERGRIRSAQSGRGLKRLKAKPDVILTSPFVRAAETASILAGALDRSDRIQTVEMLQSGGGSERHVRQLLDEELAEVMIVGHQPELSLMVEELAGRGTQLVFKKGSVCRIDLPSPLAEGQVVWLLAPKILVELGK